MASNSMIINVGVRGAKASVRAIGKVSSSIIRAGNSARKMAMNWKTMLAGFTGVSLAVREASKFGDGLREIGTLGSAVSSDMNRLSKELRLVAGEFGQHRQGDPQMRRGSRRVLDEHEGPRVSEAPT